jgi:hypothetical protein
MQATDMALARCILGKFLGVCCHFFPPPLDVSTFSARCLHVQRRERPLAAECGTLRGREMFRQIWPRIRLYFPSEKRGAGDFFSQIMIYIKNTLAGYRSIHAQILSIDLLYFLTKTFPLFDLTYVINQTPVSSIV